MAIPRPFRIVRDRAEQGAVAVTDGAVPHVREASQTLLSLIRSEYSFRVDRATALQVPAVVKALKVFSHTISAFPLREYRNDGPVFPRPFLQDPFPTATYTAGITRTIVDILLHDLAYWRVTERQFDGFPSKAVYLKFEDVNDPEWDLYGIDAPTTNITYGGVPQPAGDIIRFPGDGMGGWLSTGSTAIHTAAALEAASLRYAEFPLPSIVLKNTGADLPAEVVDDILEAWEEARASRATAYLNSVMETQTMGWNARDLQLVEARQEMAAMIARVANLDPIWVGAGVPGSSLTYSNRVDLYRQLLDTALTPVMNMISQRLTRNDVTPRGHTVKFDTSVFLRQNPGDMAVMINTLLPLGVMDITESRDLLDLPTLGVEA